MFAAYVDHVHVHCVGFAQFYYFYNYKETVSLLIVYYITLVTIIFNCVAFYFPEKQKVQIFQLQNSAPRACAVPKPTSRLAQLFIVIKNEMASQRKG